jgi:hypothetical protein
MSLRLFYLIFVWVLGWLWLFGRVGVENSVRAGQAA